MTVTRLNELAADSRKVQAAQRTALVTKLVASKRDRASKIASLDGEVNTIFARFKAPDAKFTRAALLKTVGSLEKLRAHVATARRAALSDMAKTISAGLANKGVVAQYEDLAALSAKIAALLVTAKVSLGEDGVEDEPLNEHEIVTIDSNGYVSEDNFELTEAEDMEPVDEVNTEDDLSVASDDEDADDVVEDPAETVARLKASRAKAKRASDDEDEDDLGEGELDEEVEAPAQAKAKAKAKAGKRRADDTTDPNNAQGETDDPYAETVNQLRSEDPDVDPNRVDTQPTAAKRKRAEVVDNAESTQDYPAEPEVVETPEEAVTAAGEDPAEYPADSDLVETPEEAVTAAEDGEEDEGEDTADFLDEEGETDLSLAEELELPDSGIDEALQAEILDDAELDLEDDEGQVTARVQARGGKAAQRERKLASATRTNPRASEDMVLKSLVTELMI